MTGSVSNDVPTIVKEFDDCRARQQAEDRIADAALEDFFDAAFHDLLRRGWYKDKIKVTRATLLRSTLRHPLPKGYRFYYSLTGLFYKFHDFVNAKYAPYGFKAGMLIYNFGYCYFIRIPSRINLS